MIPTPTTPPNEWPPPPQGRPFQQWQPPITSAQHFYLAGSYADRERLNILAHDLCAQGILITASWLTGWHEKNDRRVLWAQHDLHEIAMSDALIVDCLGARSTGGGRWVEVGYALAHGKPVYALLPDRDASRYDHSCFIELCRVIYVDTSDYAGAPKAIAKFLGKG